MDINIFDILFDFFNMVVEFSTQAYEILFTPIDILGNEVQLFYLLGGGFFVALFVAWFIKRFV